MKRGIFLELTSVRKCNVYSLNFYILNHLQGGVNICIQYRALHLTFHDKIPPGLELLYRKN